MNGQFKYVKYKHEGMNASHYLGLTAEWDTLTGKEAVMWSIRKWEAIVEFYDGNVGTTISDHGGLTCALCDLCPGCADCPFKQVSGETCGGPWDKYFCAASRGLRDEAREAAVEMFELLTTIYEDMP